MNVSFRLLDFSKLNRNSGNDDESEQKETTMDDKNRDFLDSIMDHEIIENWFKPGNDQACDQEGMKKIREAAYQLSKELSLSLPDNRIEKTMAILKLQEVVMWSCACLKRAHLVSNILQKRRFVEELQKQGIDFNLKKKSGEDNGKSTSNRGTVASKG